jgi:hypothetical protein
MLEVAPAGVPVVGSGISDLHLVPNPTMGMFTVSGRVSGIEGPVSYRITNMMGQQIEQGMLEVHSGKIATVQPIVLPSDLSNGVYNFAIITSAGIASVVAFIKE